ncbi:MAG: hypothetical protein NWQ46_07650, partial [Spirosomaceae bacterium]|nr:hypothetical protein [Spirosomataceae bacterium]
MKISFTLFAFSTIFCCSLKEKDKAVDLNSDIINIDEAKAFYENFQKKPGNFQTEENNYIFWDDFITFKDKEGQSYIFVSYV